MIAAKILNIASGSVYLVIFLVLFVACFLTTIFSSKRNTVLRRREIYGATIACLLIVVSQLFATTCQLLLFNFSTNKRHLYEVCGFLRTIFSGYLIPVLALALAYQHLLYQMLSTFMIIEDSATKDRVPARFKNPSTRLKQVLAIGVIVAGFCAVIFGAIPGAVVSLFHYIKPERTMLTHAHNGLQTYWDVVFLVNVIFIGLISTAMFMMGMGPRDRNGDMVARLLNFGAFIFVFELYGWSRFALSMADAGKGYLMNTTNVSRVGVVLLWIVSQLITALYVSGILLGCSSFIGNAFKNISDKISAPGTTTGTKVDVTITTISAA